MESCRSEVHRLVAYTWTSRFRDSWNPATPSRVTSSGYERAMIKEDSRYQPYMNVLGAVNEQRQPVSPSPYTSARSTKDRVAAWVDSVEGAVT
jgi:hypothetical protein